MEFELQTAYIELIKLLKLLRLVESGGMAKQVVEEGYVLRNGEVETRKRAKIVKGDVIEFNGDTVHVV
ncbi:MAG: RNA-binding S4 domain-containing protein [Mangrovibacterium sp.]